MERQLALHRPMAAAVKVKKKSISVVKPNVCVVTMGGWKGNIDHIPNHEETLHLPLKKMKKQPICLSVEPLEDRKWKK